MPREYHLQEGLAAPSAFRTIVYTGAASLLFRVRLGLPFDLGGRNTRVGC
jgi:hypothetical protein